jgi:cytochrome d ubiquinol oxidase subunit I
LRSVSTLLPFRFAHTVTAAYLTTCDDCRAVGAWHLLRNSNNPRARLMFSMANVDGDDRCAGPTVLGDLHGANSYEHQRRKSPPWRAIFETKRAAPSVLFGWPDADAQVTRYSLGIPGLASLYLAHDWNAEIKGLKAFPRDTWPTNLPLVFWAFG